MPKNKNLILSLIFGEVTSWFLILIIKNPYVEEFRKLAEIKSLVWILPIVFPIIYAAGIFIGEILSRFSKAIFQFIKFAEIGALNTFFDMGILNLLVWLTGITSGVLVIPLNTVSFLCATTNSYYLNKFWTFRMGAQLKGREFLRFLIVSTIGWIINTGIVFLGTTFLSPLAGISAGAWVNVVKLMATFFLMVWNFAGYKFVVFKS